MSRANQWVESQVGNKWLYSSDKSTTLHFRYVGWYVGVYWCSVCSCMMRCYRRV